MKMWRPERLVVGPRVATPDDVTALNQVFSDAFTDRYRRDGLVGVRVPQLNPTIWRYAIEDAGEGALLWFDERENILAFNMIHRSGTEGWMGPLAVRPDRQGLGIGRSIVEAAVGWLKDRAVRTIGLETMPRTVDNIGFYSRLGFNPAFLTMTMTGDANRRGIGGATMRLSDLSAADRDALVERCRRRLDRSVPGYDFSRELQLTDGLGIGDTLVQERGGAIVGFALWHSAPLAEDRPGDELRVLKLFADSVDTFDELMHGIERCAGKLRIRRVAIRCQTAYPQAYRVLLRRGYRVRWTDLRMTLDGFPEAAPSRGEILFSNWEI